MMRKRLGACLVVFAAGVAACSFGTSGEPSTGTGVDAPVNNTNPTPVCGDGICSASEANNCPADCGPGGNGSGSNPVAMCGDGTCQASETATSCPSDCSGAAAVCGDFVCQASETQASCPSDCTGSGSGGTLDCNDPNAEINCLICEIGGGCTGGADPTSCAACGF
jgi:hypothetical protein